ncbi:MAG: TetR family transcriptional regulator [Polyangiales bacterium]
MGLKQRARRDEDKQQRREHILKAARSLLERSPRLDSTIAEVAERASIAKGTLFLYFATREALELAVLEQELDAWFDSLDRELEADDKPWTVERLAAALTASVLVRRLMARLLVRLEPTLEHDAPAEQVAQFRHRLLDRTLRTGAAIERRLRLRAGRSLGAKMLTSARALLVGLWAQSDLSPAAAKVASDPAMAAIRVDFERDFERSLVALLHAIEAERA